MCQIYHKNIGYATTEKNSIVFEEKIIVIRLKYLRYILNKKTDLTTEWFSCEQVLFYYLRIHY
jgi:hypothetical protein